MADTVNTIQTNIHNHSQDDITNYALFLGGLNVTHDVLQYYNPLKTGYARIFMVRKPLFLSSTIPTKLNKFKHIVEYANTAISGLSDISQETQTITGGYAGASFDVATHATNSTNSVTIQVYELSGSPVREVIHSWINGQNDIMTGLATYNGLDDSIERIQANQTAEFIYVNTDNTGSKVEYACQLCNCFPTNINEDVFNYTAGTHDLVQTSLEFRCTKYESLQINEVAQKLVNKYKIMANSLNFYSGITDTEIGTGSYYDMTSGKIVAGDGTNIDTSTPRSNG